MSRLGIDLDGVGYSFTEDAREVCAADLGVNPASLPPVIEWDFPQRWGYDMARFWELIYKGVADGRVWAKRPPVPGFVECLDQLQQDGHTIHICTSRGGAEAVTMEWLDRFDVPRDSVTISRDKTIVNVDCFLDDYEGNWEALVKAGTPCVLMDQPWNCHVLGADRVYNFAQFVDYVGLLAQFGDNG